MGEDVTLFGAQKDFGMQSKDALELFAERVAAVKHLLSEASYAEIIEIFAYILGSIIAEADPGQCRYFGGISGNA